MLSAYADTGAELISDRVLSVFPENEAYNIEADNLQMSIRYSEAPNALDKTVTVNGSQDNIAEVTADGTDLKITFKELKDGTRYKVVVDDNNAGNDITTFFTTGFPAVVYSLKYEKGNIDKLYKRCNIGTAEVTSDLLEFTTISESRKSGCKITTNDIDVKAENVDKIVLGVTSEQPVTLNLYYSFEGNDKGFTNYFSFGLNGGDEEFVIDTADYPEWDGNIKQFMFEQSEPVLNTIGLKYFYAYSEELHGTKIGSFDIYENYGQANENVITNGEIEGSSATVAVSAAKSSEIESALLVAVFYKDGKIYDGGCCFAILSGDSTAKPMTVNLRTEARGHIKAFLRYGVRDIRNIIPSISTQIN